MYLFLYLYYIVYNFNILKIGCKIDDSCIPNAGDGLYWDHTEPVKVDTIVVVGSGVIKPSDDFDNVFDRKYVYQLDTSYYLDATPDRTLKPMMCFGAKLNDPFNKKLVNCAVTLLKNANSEWMAFFLIRAVKVIKPKDELYMEYGPDHWMYSPNFNELSPDQQEICKEYYELEDDDFYGPKTTYQEEHDKVNAKAALPAAKAVPTKMGTKNKNNK